MMKLVALISQGTEVKWWGYGPMFARKAKGAVDCFSCVIVVTVILEPQSRETRFSLKIGFQKAGRDRPHTTAHANAQRETQQQTADQSLQQPQEIRTRTTNNVKDDDRKHTNKDHTFTLTSRT